MAKQIKLIIIYIYCTSVVSATPRIVTLLLPSPTVEFSITDFLFVTFLFSVRIPNLLSSFTLSNGREYDSDDDAENDDGYDDSLRSYISKKKKSRNTS